MKCLFFQKISVAVLSDAENLLASFLGDLNFPRLFQYTTVVSLSMLLLIFGNIPF